jgi:hypothetical protein
MLTIIMVIAMTTLLLLSIANEVDNIGRVELFFFLT